MAEPPRLVAIAPFGAVLDHHAFAMRRRRLRRLAQLIDVKTHDLFFFRATREFFELDAAFKLRSRYGRLVDVGCLGLAASFEFSKDSVKLPRTRSGTFWIMREVAPLVLLFLRDLLRPKSEPVYCLPGSVGRLSCPLGVICQRTLSICLGPGPSGLLWVVSLSIFFQCFSFSYVWFFLLS